MESRKWRPHAPGPRHLPPGLATHQARRRRPQVPCIIHGPVAAVKDLLPSRLQRALGGQLQWGQRSWSWATPLHCPVGGSMDGLDEVGGPGVQWGFQRPPAQLDSKTASRWPQHSDHPWMVAPATAAHGNHSACKTSEQQRTQTTPVCCFRTCDARTAATPRPTDHSASTPASQPAGSHLHPSVLPSPEARSAASTPNIKHCLVSRAASRAARNIRPKQYMPQCLANAALATR